ncbi:MAG: polyisoprenyl-teichoic acid--peptidoglycan teichoic acid transferase [Gaiellales bacterium]|nr:polyisoprenyl-teichoic acid--peptidoglycan teichoic acid transferase [Gaiellales bacterium]
MRPDDPTVGMGAGARGADMPKRAGRRWWRWLLVTVAVLALLVVVGSALAWMSYDGFRSQVAVANTRLPDAVTRALGPPPPRDRPSTVLVAAPGAEIGSVVVMRTAPANHHNSVILLPETLTVEGATLGDLAQTGTVPALITGIEKSGIPVDHVILIDPAKMGDLVDALGGVTIINPSAGTVEAGNRQFGFEKGEITIDGAAAEAYASARKGRELSTLRGERQARLLAGIGSTLLLPRGVETARQIGPALKDSAATDLVALDIAAWSSERFEGPTSTRCVPKGTQLEPGIVDRFLAGTPAATQTGTCTEHSLSSPIPGPAADIAAGAGRNLESVLAWWFAVSWLTLTFSVLALVLTTESFAALSRRIRSRSEPVAVGPSRHQMPAPRLPAPGPAEQHRQPSVQTPPLRVEAASSHQPEAEHAPRAAFPGGHIGRRAGPWSSTSRRVRSALRALPSALVARIRRGVGPRRLSEGFETRRESVRYGRLNRGSDRSGPRRAGALLDRLAESRDRRRENRRLARGHRERPFERLHPGRLEAGSPPLAAYVAGGIMVAAGAAALILLLLAA